jgi:ribosomal protein L35
MEGLLSDMLTVKSYFDGSELTNRALTLAAIGADEATWNDIEPRWEEIRTARGNPPHIHMSDLMALEGLYEDWSGDARDYLVDGLLNVLLSFRGHPNLFSFTCSINLVEYDEVRKEKRLPVPERMCARFVFPHVMNWYAELPRLDIGKMDVYFDRNEKFMRHIQPDWTSKQIRKRHPQWELVNSIGQAIMETTPALQMTDVVAWGRNRLASGSHWETDPHYATAVRACGSLYSIYRPIDRKGLKAFQYTEEGYAAIDPQRNQRDAAMAKRYASEEFKRFDGMMRHLMYTLHPKIKKELEQEQTVKKPKKFKNS